MKRISFFLALAFVVVSFGLSSAGEIYVSNASGLWNDAGTFKVIPGGPVSFDIHVLNDVGSNVAGMTNGFRIYGPASYTALAPSFLDGEFDKGGGGSYFDLVGQINNYSLTGSGADSMGYVGSVLGGSGMPDGYDGDVWRLSTGGVAEGQTLCVDSCFFPTSGTWLWAPGGQAGWGNLGGYTANFSAQGGYCFVAETPPCIPPNFTVSTNQVNGSHCDLVQFDFDAELDANDGDGVGPTYSADLGTIDPNTGAWSYAGSLADVGQSVVANISASNGTCETTIQVDIVLTNAAPQPLCPNNVTVSVGSPSVFALTANDDCDPFSWAIGDTDIDGTVSIDANTGVMTVVADNPGNYYIDVEASDGNATGSCRTLVEAIAGSIYQVEIPCLGDQEENFIFQGQMVEVPINFAGPIIGGFNFLVAYDNSALSFQYAEAGPAIVQCGWEYFTYRYGADGNCSNACPSGLLRVVGIAETNNGPNHPQQDCPVTGTVALLTFLVTNDRTFECSEIPIRFFWLECGDNSLSNWLGDSLFISEFVYDADEVLFPPFGQEIQNFDYGYPTYFGSQNVDCDTEEPKAAYRMVSFNNGCLFIACADSIDARGDVNLNNVGYEIADAVLYSNYFVYGLGVFNVNLEGQIAASDVNADGIALSVADLVYLIRVVIGDALPYPKLAPVSTVVTDSKGILTVEDDMGAALVVINGNVSPELLADNMTLKYDFDVNTNTTRALVYSMNGTTFSGEFLNANGNVVSVELGSAEGATVTAKVLPGNFELAQNYPNPFNPSTAISFSIPFTSDVNLTIYNITGQKVAEFDGSYEAGVHIIEWDASNMASGVYFYKLNAGDFSDTKKMVLMK